MNQGTPPSFIVCAALIHLFWGRFAATFIYWFRYRKNPNIDLAKQINPQTSIDKAHIRVTKYLAALYILWIIALAFAPFINPLLAIPAQISWSCLALSLAGMTCAQIQMGEAFRIGQESHTKSQQNELKQTGLLKFSRNPIYVFSYLYVASVSSMAPNWIVLSLCLGIGCGIHCLVLIEETFLASRFGPIYAEYRKNTPRYLEPWRLFSRSLQ